MNKLIILLSFFAISSGIYAQGSKDKIIKSTTRLDAQSAKDGSGLVDLKEAKELTLFEAALQQGNIDLVYAYGKSTGINLMTPSSSRFKYFKLYNGTIENWDVRNKGTLIALGNNKAHRKAYRKIKKGSQVKAIYTEALSTVALRDDYKKSEHGPQISIYGLKLGDYFVFRSKSRDIYAVGRIVNGTKGYSGSVTIDWKIAVD